ncbi:DUF480 domain-containing protein [Nocardioides sp. R-C-SC26]|uniref:DUF480 domain-containing protein n=1 Tax=Nocardioides sp. R-C-SC26 TaxID=2870414 RepID=UPI001E3CF8A6|nr:DUF480 domain-containing protein [Nocardioides sp. R-C-SC26]
MTLPALDAVEQRLLGALLEKQVTVPASYPMTANGLRTACNQSSSRQPVTDYDERTVTEGAKALKDRDLVRIVWSDSGRRTLKYHQLLSDVLDLDAAERAVVTVLLLRGPLSPGEVRTSADRLHAFADKAAAEATLNALAARDEPLVRALPRRAGAREVRWVHLLGDRPVDVESPGGAGDPGSASSEPDVDPEARDARVEAAYDAIAPAYADALVDELDHLPFERWLLDRVVRLAGAAPVVEAGCGPGHPTARLADLGAAATGLDVTAAMIEQARARFGQATYEVGDLRRLMRPTTAGGWGAVLAWYSLIHFGASELPTVIEGLVRPLQPGGWLVYAGHAGTGVRQVEEWFGHDVGLSVVEREPADVAALFETAGLVDVEWYRRAPISARGETTERAYVLGRRPGGGAH